MYHGVAVAVTVGVTASLESEDGVMIEGEVVVVVGGVAELVGGGGGVL